LQAKTGRYAAFAVSALALIYALFAGLRTVGDPDLGWQLATGRWIVQHRAIPATDILSYTAQGREWIYPALSQLVLYSSYQLGGYSLLSWLGAAACVGTIAILLRGHLISKVLTVLAVPLIAARTPPRAEMFTEVLFATFLSTLWCYHRSGRGRLWILPPLMCLWANLHLGFISGLGVCGAYVFLELGDALCGGRRTAALVRLRYAAPWLMATVLAPFLNPWGPRIYVAVVRQADILRVHSRWMIEWMRVPITPGTLVQAFEWRDPRSALWWLIATALIAMLVAASRRQFAAAVLLGASVYLVVHSIRFEGPFASVAIVIGGFILADALRTSFALRIRERAVLATGNFRPIVATLAMVTFLAFVGVRVGDLVSNRYYLRTGDQFSVFGPGESWWYPEDALSSLARERLPGHIFNEFNLGGFVAWRLSPAYPDYIDGRSVPFGNELFFRSLGLLQSPLDSAKWQREADARNINTVVVSLDRTLGGGLASLGRFCQSQSWRTVYLDTRAAIFVRDRPETRSLLSALQLDCDKVQFDAPPPVTRIRGNSDRVNYYLNSAAILLVLGRITEAQNQLQLAEQIFPGSSDLHFLKGIVFVDEGFSSAAEQEFRTSLEIEPADVSAQALAHLYKESGRFNEAAMILSRASARSAQPYQLYLDLGFVQLDLGLPEQALISFDQAEKGSPFVEEAAPLGAEFNVRLAEGRENAWRRLAEIYEARGLRVEALHARQQESSAESRRLQSLALSD
jgi:tetratricopeptide (TPR) repeat protein